MSEESDLEKTEQASSARIEKAREQGDVPRSKELSTCALLLAAGIGAWLLEDRFNIALKKMLTSGLTFDRGLAFDTEVSIHRMVELITSLFIAFSPLAVILILVALGAPILLGGWNFCSELLIPKFSRLNPLTGITNMISKNSLVELLKAIAKSLVVGTAGYLVIEHAYPSLHTLFLVPLDVGIARTQHLLVTGFILTVGGLILIAAIDVPYQLFHYAEKMKMSKQEVRQESRESDGNPEIKARIRRIQREMARRRMMEEIPNADVIITNPTHYAVAIQYSEQGMRAPKLLAKGMDSVALKIREIGKLNNILTLESPKLARALYAHTELNSEIPEALYIAVAEILAYVFKVRQFNRRDGAYPEQPEESHVPDELDPSLSETKNRQKV